MFQAVLCAIVQYSPVSITRFAVYILKSIRLELAEDRRTKRRVGNVIFQISMLGIFQQNYKTENGLANRTGWHAKTNIPYILIQVGTSKHQVFDAYVSASPGLKDAIKYTAQYVQCVNVKAQVCLSFFLAHL